MTSQTRDHRRAAWMSTGGRRGISHLVPQSDQPTPSLAAVQRKTLCGKSERAVWTPVIPGELVKCRACSKSAAKRNVEIVEPA